MKFFPHARLMKTKHFGWAIITRLLRRLLYKKYYKTFDQALCFFFIPYTALKVSAFGVILVRIFPHSDWIRKVMTRITPNTGFFTHCYRNKISVEVFSHWFNSVSHKDYPANIYMFKVNNRNTRKMCEICSKLIIKTPERRQWRQWRRSGVFVVNFEHISRIFQLFYCWVWASKC